VILVVTPTAAQTCVLVWSSFIMNANGPGHGRRTGVQIKADDGQVPASAPIAVPNSALSATVQGPDHSGKGWLCNSPPDCTGAVPMWVFRVLLGNLSLFRICKLHILHSLS
jgi:hypothetical protein